MLLEIFLSVRAKHRVFKNLHIPSKMKIMAIVVISGLFWPLLEFLEARLRINAARVPVLSGIPRNPYVLENGAILHMDFFAESFVVDIERRSLH